MHDLNPEKNTTHSILRLYLYNKSILDSHRTSFISIFHSHLPHFLLHYPSSQSPHFLSHHSLSIATFTISHHPLSITTFPISHHPFSITTFTISHHPLSPGPRSAAATWSGDLHPYFSPSRAVGSAPDSRRSFTAVTSRASIARMRTGTGMWPTLGSAPENLGEGWFKM